MTYPAVTLAVVDGNSFARAAHVPGREFVCARFLQRLGKTREFYPGVKLHVAWDARDNVSGRRAWFDAYKRNRASRPVDHGYLAQLEELRHLLPRVGVPQWFSPGWEADDVIATLVRGRRRSSVVLSRDKDLVQLAAEGVRVLLRIGSAEQLLDAEGASAFLGFPVSVHRDWKALAGDAGDGVPGVRGIGAKKATELLRWRPALVDDVLAGRALPDPGTAAMRTALRRIEELGRDGLRVQRDLVTLHDVPLTGVRPLPVTDEVLDRLRELRVKASRLLDL